MLETINVGEKCLGFRWILFLFRDRRIQWTETMVQYIYIYIEAVVLAAK